MIFREMFKKCMCCCSATRIKAKGESEFMLAKQTVRAREADRQAGVVDERTAPPFLPLPCTHPSFQQVQREFHKISPLQLHLRHAIHENRHGLKLNHVLITGLPLVALEPKQVTELGQFARTFQPSRVCEFARVNMRSSDHGNVYDKVSTKRVNIKRQAIKSNREHTDTIPPICSQPRHPPSTHARKASSAICPRISRRRDKMRPDSHAHISPALTAPTDVGPAPLMTVTNRSVHTGCARRQTPRIDPVTSVAAAPPLLCLRTKGRKYTTV